MNEKSIFAYKIFIEYLRFKNLFFMCPPPHLKKVTPLFPRNPPLKVEVLSSPAPLPPTPLSFWKFGLEFNPFPSRKGGAHYIASGGTNWIFLLSLVTSLIFQCFLIFSMIFPRAELFLSLQKSFSKIFFGFFLNFVFNSKYGF